jgi:GxxExxY protein
MRLPTRSSEPRSKCIGSSAQGSSRLAYEEALCVELQQRGIPFARQVRVVVVYKGRPIASPRIDLLVDGRLIVELKAVESLQAIHVAQVRSYLKATGCVLGLLMNFNLKSLQPGIKRIVLSG